MTSVDALETSPSWPIPAQAALCYLIGMSLTQTAPRMTVDEFVEWAARQAEGRYELVDGEIVRMPAEGGEHNRVKLRLARLLEDAVNAVGFAGVVYTDGMTVETVGGRGREPDAVVSAGPPADPKAKVVPDPLIIVEVVSPDSYGRDMGTKLVEYAALPSLQHYVVVVIEDRLVIHHRRTSGSELITRPLRAGDLTLDPPGLVLPIAKMFEVLQGCPRPR